jgi:hypothetical protein
MGFAERFPRWATAILAIAQLILTAAIIGLEFGSFYYDVAHGTIWAGFWSGLVFILTFLMMFIISKLFIIKMSKLIIICYLI